MLPSDHNRIPLNLPSRQNHNGRRLPIRPPKTDLISPNRKQRPRTSILIEHHITRLDQGTHRCHTSAHQRNSKSITSAHCRANRYPDHFQRLRDGRWWDVGCGESFPDIMWGEEVAVVLVAEDGYGQVSGWGVTGDVDAYFGEGSGF